MKTTETASGLIVITETNKKFVNGQMIRTDLTPEEKRQRRQDNKRMKQIHSKVRRRRKHGR